MDINQVADAIVANVKTNKWLSCHFDVTYKDRPYQLGVKSFGRWVQRLELCGLVSNVPEQKTNKRMRELVILELDYLFKSLGA